MYSFDILDTCFCRTCGEPYAVFDLLARYVLGDNISQSQLADFRYIRIKGEHLAREKRIAEDVTIKQIYDECDFRGLTSLSNEELIEKEIDVERHVLRPIFETLKLIKDLHEKNEKVVFISDMYLPSLFFENLLKEFEFWKDGDLIFVSCEIGKTKATGNLYKYIAEKENFIFKNWHHQGDNRNSDYKVPKKLGISCKHKEFEYSKTQYKMKNANLCISENFMARLAGISKSLCVGMENDCRVNFAADYLAPLYVSFVYGILKHAFEHGIKFLFFLARDGYMLYKIAQEMQWMFPSVGINYLYVSRKSLYLPHIKNLTTEELVSIMPNKYASREELFDNLQISEQQMKSIGDDFEGDNLVEIVKKKWKEQRENVILYFKQEGLASNEYKSAIVDIRGSRKCHRYINQILSDYGYESSYAYFLEVTSDRIFPNSSDEYYSVYFGDYIRSDAFRHITDVEVFLYERYFCISDALRTIGYSKTSSGEIVPEYEQEEFPDIYAELCRINESVCLRYCREFIYNKLYLFYDSISNISLHLISEFARKPSREYLKVLSQIEFKETRYSSTRIVGMITPTSIIKKNIKWGRGSLMMTCPILMYLYDIFSKMIRKIR